MASTQLNLDDFHDSPYADEMRRGSTWDLRFGDGLENEYRSSHIQRVHLRAKVWFSLSIVLTIFFALRRAHRTGIHDLEVVLNLGLLLPCVTALAWLTWSSRFAQWYLPTARILTPLYNVVVSALIARGLARGDNQMAGLTLNVLAVFFLSGLMYRDAVLTTLLMIVGFATSALYIHLEPQLLIPSMVILVLTVLVGAIAMRDVERPYRSGFLEVALIGELVARDGLTGLMNRRTFDEHLLRVWQHAMRDRQSIAVLMIDIDHFKEYNDGFGHQAGDGALRSVARSVQESARRPLDLAARFGGEEFAVIFYDLSPAHVHEMAEHIRLRVQGLQIRRPAVDGTAGTVTVSIGVGLVSPTLGRTPQGAVQLADEALYEAKRAGRNRIVVKGVEDYRLLDTGAFKNAAPLARLQS